jgi:hypothetical protein
LLSFPSTSSDGFTRLNVFSIATFKKDSARKHVTRHTAKLFANLSIPLTGYNKYGFVSLLWRLTVP